ncbi:MAG: hypothetical protein A2Z03_07015 [Chloroflexi bacterium RBG_16_56_8]|nr:MAG: hypothetical protein A2Z03_07015 [Chloroflexi bacterium RBG_16_56_8]
MKRNTRLALSLSGAIDALIGGGLLLIGFRILPVDIAAYGLPQWLAIPVGAVMAITGASVAVYNFTRLDEL